MELIFDNKQNKFVYVYKKPGHLMERQKEIEEIGAALKEYRWQLTIENRLNEILQILTTQPLPATAGVFPILQRTIDQVIVPAPSDYNLNDPSGNELDRCVLDCNFSPCDYSKFRLEHPDGQQIETNLVEKLKEIRQRIMDTFTPDFIESILQDRSFDDYVKNFEEGFREEILCAKFAAWGQMIDAIVENIDFFKYCCSEDSLRTCHGHLCNIQQWVWWEEKHDNTVSYLDEFQKVHYLVPRNFITSLRDLPDWN